MLEVGAMENGGTGQIINVVVPDGSGRTFHVAVPPVAQRHGPQQQLFRVSVPTLATAEDWSPTDDAPEAAGATRKQPTEGWLTAEVKKAAAEGEWCPPQEDRQLVAALSSSLIFITW